MDCLEDKNGAANLVSIDFEKAFNRMDHGECLEALEALGASEEVVKWTAAFLYDRKMSVKIRQARSVPRKVPGGSPQGSILGNYLFCATTNCFAELPSPDIATRTERELSSSDGVEDEVAYEPAMQPVFSATPANCVSTPTARGQFETFRPPRCLLDLSGEFESDDDSIHFFRPNNRFAISSSDEDSTELIQIPNSSCMKPLASYVYIDDYNTIEKLCLAEAETHLTIRSTEGSSKCLRLSPNFSLTESRS